MHTNVRCPLAIKLIAVCLAIHTAALFDSPARAADRPNILDHTEGIVGFYGASSMERLPVEPAIRNQVRAFCEMKV